MSGQPESDEGAASPERSPARRLLALVVDDDTDFRESLALLIRRARFEVLEAPSLAQARDRLAERAVDVVFVDLGLPDGHGLELFGEDEPSASRPELVVVTGNATVDAAVDALRQGVLDFLSKPIDRHRLQAILAHVVRTRELRGRVDELRGELRDLGRFGSLIGRSSPMQQVYDLIARVAPTRATVLLLGESGTGKELAAETVHRMSPRAREAFLAVNCGAVAQNVIESELFGHQKGSFTGAERTRRGYFEETNGGTLFLDEIAEMSPDLQVKLLRVLETGTFLPVGASQPVPTDVRLIAATNRDPEKAVREGRLRNDLYYRLNVFPVVMPPLRAREDDVELLASHFLERYNAAEGTQKRWSFSALRALRAYPWPGNVRELRNLVERAAILAEQVIEHAGLPDLASAPADPGSNGPSLTLTIGESLSEVERKVILGTLRSTAGDKPETARRLGISLKTLYNRLKIYEAGGHLDVDGAAAP